MATAESSNGKVSVSGGPSGLAQVIETSEFRFPADEPVALGGTGTGPNPYEILLAALGSCTGMTLRLYADRKGWPLEGVRVRLRHGRVHAADCADCGNLAAEAPSGGKIDVIEREIELLGALDDEQKRRLLEIADRCPVHRTLSQGVKIRTRGV
jgi:putative redox protein